MSSGDIVKCYVAFAVAEKQWYRVFSTMDHSKIVKFKQEHNSGGMPFAVLGVTYIETCKEAVLLRPEEIYVDEICNSCVMSPSETSEYFIGFIKQGPPEQLEWIRTLKTSDEAEMMAFYDDKVKAGHAYAIVTGRYRETDNGIKLPLESLQLHSAFDPKPPKPCPIGPPGPNPRTRA